MKYKLVSFDLDGTLFRVSVHRYIAERLGKLEEFETIAQRLKKESGEYEKFIAEIYQTLSVFSIKEFLEWMKELPKIKNLEKGIEELKKAGLRVVVLSDCSSYVEEYLKQYRFDNYLFGWEQKIEDGKISKQIERRESKLEVFEAIGFSILLNPKEDLNVKINKMIKSEDLMEVVKLMKHENSHF